MLDLFSVFHRDLVDWIHEIRGIAWLEAPIVWGCLIGATLLWGRWDHVSWQRRAGCFLVMSLVDLGLWFVDRGDAIGPAAVTLGIAGCATIWAKPWAGASLPCFRA